MDSVAYLKGMKPSLALLINRCFLALLFFGSGGVTSLRGADEAQDAILIPVEEGIRRVVVEVWDADQGEWVPFSTAHLGGKPGTVKLPVPVGRSASEIRVRVTESPMFPDSFIGFAKAEKSEKVSDGAGYMDYPGAPIETFAVADDSGRASANSSSVVESDIWKVDGDIVYFFNNLRGLQVFDLSDPESPLQVGSLRYPGSGDQMYILNSDYLLLLARDGAGGRVELVRLNDGDPYLAKSFSGIPGSLLESRMVGQRLYFVSQVYESYHENDEWFLERRIVIHTFDFSDPTSPARLDPVSVEIENGWGNVVSATNEHLIVAANTYFYEQNVTQWHRRGWHYASEVSVFDIGGNDGLPVLVSQGSVSGRIADKFKIDFSDDGVLTVISEAQGYDSVNGRSYLHTVLENFSIESSELELLGDLELASGERLYATRFDGDRAYVVTFRRVDPLFVVGLSDPARPVLLGELEIPGWSDYLQVLPNGRLFSIGREDRRVAVSLFDVGDPSAMTLLDREYLGPEDGYSWSEGNYNEKAVTVLPDSGLAMVPYQHYDWSNGTSSHELGLQLLSFDDDALSLRGTIFYENRVRRSAPLESGALVSVSNQELLTIDVSDLDSPEVLADETIAWRVDRVAVVGEYLIQMNLGASYLWGGYGSNDAATIQVSPRDEPESILAEYSMNVSGLNAISIRGGYLHVLGKELVYGEGSGQMEAVRFKMESYDLTDPLNIEKAGSAEKELPTERYLSGRFKPEWTGPSTLLWIPDGNSYNYGWCGMVDFAGGAADVATCYALPFYYNPGDAVVLSVDVSNPSAPEFLDAQLYIGLPDRYDTFSEGFYSGGRVFISDEVNWHVWVEENEPSGGSKSRYEYHSRSDLIVFDVNNPADIRIRAPIEYDGRLVEARPFGEDGTILYAMDFSSSYNPDTSVVDASGRVIAQGYDGTQVFEIDSIEFEGSGFGYPSDPNLQFLDDVFYSPTISYQENDVVETQIARLHFASSGQFELLDPIPVDSASSLTLDLVDEFLFARGSEGIDFWELDGVEASSFGRFETHIPYWWGTEDPYFDRDVGLWIPTGDYGVDFFPIQSAVPFDPSEAFRDFDGAVAGIEQWSEIDSSAWKFSTMSGSDSVGRLVDLLWLFRRAESAKLDTSATDYGDYWFRSAWLGWYYQEEGGNWSYLLAHGWQYAFPADGGAYLYDLHLGWLWFSRNYPEYVYSYGRQSWLYYLDGSGETGTRWFFDFSAAVSDWFSVARD